MRKFFILFIILIICLTGCVYAGNLVKKVYFSPYPIIIDSEEYSSEMPILSYQDRTYVALREFSEMVGVEIDFVNETIIINTEEEKNIVKDIDKDNLVYEENIDEENLLAQKSQIVYITQTGTKYHLKSNCSKGKYYTSTLDVVSKDGYTPCKKCAE